MCKYAGEMANGEFRMANWQRELSRIIANFHELAGIKVHTIALHTAQPAS